jgi:hypothetical protein
MMSSGKFPDPQRTRAYRRRFIDLWAAFLRENFTSTAHVAVVFSCDEATARSWWNAVNAPSGYAVAIAFKEYPAQAACHLTGGWGGCSLSPWGRVAA